MRATLVSPDTVSYIWPQVERFIRPAFDVPCDEPADSAIDDIHSGDAHLWVAHNKAGVWGAAIARLLLLENKKKVYQVIACGGEQMSEWIDCLSAMEKFAKQSGCYALRISGRPGWKMLKSRGYKEPFIILEKGL